MTQTTVIYYSQQRSNTMWTTFMAYTQYNVRQLLVYVGNEIRHFNLIEHERGLNRSHVGTRNTFMLRGTVVVKRHGMT